EGRIYEAEDLANEVMAGIPEYQSHYEPLGDLFIIPEGSERITILGIREYWNGQLNRIEEIPDYKRELDIDTGIHTVSYTKDGVKNVRESFISYPDRVMVIKSSGLPLAIFAERANQCEKVYKLDDRTLCMEGRPGNGGPAFCMVFRAVEGNPYIKGRTLHTDADAVILVASQTEFYCKDYVADAVKTIDDAEKLGYAKLKERHIADVSELMNRCTLSIECENRDDVPTDERLGAVRDGGEDNGLINLSFAYGRYLLISSSRVGSLPANLQGIWNDSFSPMWDSKYTININAQMNYWPAENTGLSELHFPLFELIKRMVPNGRKAASEMYGARGWMAHHNTDIWGDCAPQDTCTSSTYWQMGAAWLCLHILEHYRYTKDRAFMEEYLPIVKEAALFFEDTLIDNGEGKLVVSPTVSPENTYVLPNGEKGTMCEGASMDAQILYELFGGLIETGMLTDDEKSRYTEILDKLPKPVISDIGTIQEWSKPYEEVEIGHRHISHLF
ncbi:MAG: glycoside hydrolase N-terminal domain-containing protein, partial [Lachnospiraceae bacterium]|nr:glycoside hydrolase N-terminal domain-containing protein [Lachnospiraceae bacterium]